MEITDLIDALEDTIESGGKVPLTGKRTIDMDRVGDIIDRLRAAIPDEIRSAHEIRSRSEAIVTDAVMAAKQIKASAEKERQSSLEENSIIQAAHERAKEILGRAEEEAEKLRRQGDLSAAKRIQEADGYAENSLMKLGAQMAAFRAQSASLESAVTEIEKSIDLGTKVLQAGRAHSGKNGTNGTSSHAVATEPLAPEDLKVDGLLATPLASTSDDVGPIDVDAMVAAAEEKVSKRR
jgi:hypothetical protein